MDEKIERNVDNEIVIPDLAEEIIEEIPEGILLSVILDDKGYVTQFCTGGTLGNETTHFYADIPEDFFSLYKAYRVEDAALVLDTKRVADVENETELVALRAQREEECFRVINRGRPWYDRLTEEQYKELDAWYQAWLDITEKKKGAKGFSVPAKPKWLE